MTILSEFPHAVDNSMRKELVKCETAAKYKYELGLQSLESNRVDLHAGKAFAAGMEAMRKAHYVEGLTAGEALNLGVARLYVEYGPFIAPPKSNKTADRMAGALAFYAEQAPFAGDIFKPIKFPDGTYGIEVGFNHTIPIEHPTTNKPLTYCGRFDMLAQDENGDAWVIDEKTTSQMGEKWANQWPLDSQMTGYCWGAQKLLQQHSMDIEVKGAIINGIAIRLRDYEHGRFVTYREDWQVERWYAQMLRNVYRWAEAHKSGAHDQALDHACAQYNNPCEFALLCQSRNPERLIEGGSYIVRRWNPLTREES